MVSRLKKGKPPSRPPSPKSKPIKEIPARRISHFCLAEPRGILSGASPDLIPFLIGLPVEYILISFGDVVTALCLGTPESSNFDKDFNKKHNAKMMPAWS